jgi:outer membrane murein-binding lipoprotein Lpp
MIQRMLLLAVLAACLPLLHGCTSAGVAIRENVFGQAKRDQLVSSVKDAREEQEEAKQQFASALDEFLVLTKQDGGELEKQYRKFQKEYDRCEDAAESVRDDISKVEVVAKKLFSEWNSELSQFSNAQRRSESERMLRDTQRQYDQMIDAMKNASSKMDPVLANFKDLTLFLKHSLNAQAIRGLQSNVSQVQSDVGRLIAEMETSIKEADAFISQMAK